LQLHFIFIEGFVQKDNAKEIIGELVARFSEQIDSYRHSDYNETQTRRDFIDPFFKALGWDVDNQNGYAEAYREVIHEDKIKIAGATKAPDYSFRLAGGKRLFFVEAKKPSIAVKDDILPAYQIRRYGWSAKHPISIITDFEEFAIYDCTKKPNPTDKASVARIKYFTFENYLNEFDFLWETFSKERVLKGSFDKFVQNDTNKKGTTTVDKEFLSSLDQWRTDLAVNISKQNQHLNEDELNFVVQQTIDRIIFLRIAEDRHIEPYGSLRDSLKQGDYYRNMFDLFRQADEKYNSGLFDLKKDKISKSLVVDNKILKKIINELYYPESPYEFSVLSVEILGSAYEQFLGKTIRIDKSHRAKIEEKPEVRKSGGVYYTPQYIVDYIVKNTVGKLIEGKSPKEIDKIKIVDPACGSGSFLIGAYQYLLDYHKNYYTDAGTKTGKKETPITPQGNLTSNEKKRILLNNIFGVDIDTNAVEVTKLSLLLKCMEGENENSIAIQYKLWHERILPTLDNNIKSGNSLIDTDFFDTQLDFGDERKIKPFNWSKAFPEIFISGGFDIVIGNPPYGYMISKEQLNYFEQKYKHQDYQKDLYLLFLERYSFLLKKNAQLGVIISNTWLQSITLRKIRTYLLSNFIWKKILLLPKRVFNAIIDTHVIIFQAGVPEVDSCFEVEILKGLEPYFSHSLYQSQFKDNGLPINVLSNQKSKDLFVKIESYSTPLSDYCKVYNGVKPFEKGKGSPPQTQKIMTEKPFVKDGLNPGKGWKPLLRGSLINRYTILWSNNYWILYGKWLAAPRDSKIFDNSQMLFVRQTGDSLICSYAKKGFIARDNLHIIISDKIDLFLLLGIINSNLMDFIYTYINPEKGEALAQVKKHHIEMLPIKNDFNEPQNYKYSKEIILNVHSLIKSYEERNCSTLQSKIEQIQSRITYHEEKINLAVYQLYGLTDDEIKILEDAIKK
jgi:type I restriction-modification system DNA methylase subunit